MPLSASLSRHRRAVGTDLAVVRRLLKLAVKTTAVAWIMSPWLPSREAAERRWVLPAGTVGLVMASARSPVL